MLGVAVAAEKYLSRWRTVTVMVLALFPLIATSTATSGPSGGTACSGEEVRATIASFVSAFNRGDQPALDTLFAAAPDFGWYSSNSPGLRNNAASKDRTTLLAYFRLRHSKDDRLRLVSVGFSGSSPSYEYGNIDFRMQRSASDYANGRWFPTGGKAAVVCEGSSPGRIAVLSMGGDYGCPATVAGRATGGFAASGFNFGTARLRAHLHWWRTRELLAGRLPDGGYAATIARDGTIRTKVGWWRGAPGNVRITIRPFRGSRPTTHTRGPGGYGETGFQPSILTFPGTGCWNVTGNVGRSQISFVVRVARVS